MPELLAIVPPYPEYGDIGEFGATVIPHAYLHCWDCGERLWWGDTETDATIYACRRCQVVTDVRRVA